MELLGHRVDITFNFLRNFQNSFPKWWHHFIASSAVYLGGFLLPDSQVFRLNNYLHHSQNDTLLALQTFLSTFFFFFKTFVDALQGHFSSLPHPIYCLSHAIYFHSTNILKDEKRLGWPQCSEQKQQHITKSLRWERAWSLQRTQRKSMCLKDGKQKQQRGGQRGG